MLRSGIRFGETPEQLAAVDLGSTSFHLVVGRVDHDRLSVIDRMREMVRLAAGLDENHMLAESAQHTALECLERFGQRLRDMPPGTVRAVGTSTLRRARNNEVFRLRAEEALGHPIEVIAGREEARLIYLGVARSVAGGARHRLVIDIGGGSTEIIAGEGLESHYRESLEIGCVNATMTWFPGGRIRKDDMRRAELAARLEFEPLETLFREFQRDVAVGSSGTIRTVGAVLNAQGWSDGVITRSGVRRLRRALIQAGHVDALRFPGLRDERRPVFPGGVAILGAALDALAIDRLEVSDGAMREGVLYDLMGRYLHSDARESTVESLCQRFGVDRVQAARVESTALALLAQVADGLDLGGDEYRGMLCWACRLHEMGLSVSHSKYHRHGAYLLEHSDMPGFSNQDQAVLATLVLGHRRGFAQSAIDQLPASIRGATRYLAVILRLAVLMHRHRSPDPLPSVRITLDPAGVEIYLPAAWLSEHPLTRADLDEEGRYLEATGLSLQVRPVADGPPSATAVRRRAAG
jgi:exopolyphosphatase / guanosine-5'-triphosphate,3'-diphosphate pyrophosphatase